MQHVARRAGVSTATVSYVLNATPGQTITEATRARVLDAAADLHYVLHSPGRVLRQGTSRTVIADVGSLDQSGPTLGRLLRGMSDELRRHDHALLITVGGDGHRDEILGTIAPRAVFDFTRVTFGTTLDDVISGTFEGVHVGYPYQSLIQLRHLAERGHTRIATVLPSGPLTDMATLRLRHWAEAATRLAVPRPLPVRLSSTDPSRTLRGALIDGGCTAVAAYDDATAVQVISVLGEIGLRCPDDVAVMGFDDAAISALWRPAITTLRVDAPQYGRRAAQIALGLEPDAWTTPPSRVVARASA